MTGNPEVTGSVRVADQLTGTGATDDSSTPDHHDRYFYWLGGNAINVFG
jgi:hypothetical protein